MRLPHRVLLLFASCAAAAPAAADPLREQARALFASRPEVARAPAEPVTPEQVALGRALFFETRLAPGRSCNGCHRLDAFGVDGERTPLLADGKRGERNTPSVYNAALQLALLWDGRAANLEEHAARGALGAGELGVADEARLREALRAVPGYAPLFAAAFPGDLEPLTAAHVGRALGAFQRQLVTASRFDAWLDGDDGALSGAERQGLETFLATGCAGCHDGIGIGGGRFEKLGREEPYPSADKGRALWTGRSDDERVFKVPSLRNVAKTGPWLHDGSVATLDMAVRVMARVQLGRTLTGAEAASIVAFLAALTGEPPRELVAPPALPEGAPTAAPPG
jgi:cytochrome c peroxidase